jgi:hypothetical protein
MKEEVDDSGEGASGLPLGVDDSGVGTSLMTPAF